MVAGEQVTLVAEFESATLTQAWRRFYPRSNSGLHHRQIWGNNQMTVRLAPLDLNEVPSSITTQNNIKKLLLSRRCGTWRAAKRTDRPLRHRWHTGRIDQRRSLRRSPRFGVSDRHAAGNSKDPGLLPGFVPGAR